MIMAILLIYFNKFQVIIYFGILIFFYIIYFNTLEV